MKIPLIILLATVASLLAGAATSQSASPGNPTKHFQLPIPPELTQSILASNRSYKLSKAGNDFAKQGDWQNAQDSYQQALDQYPTNRDALYGMAECSHVAGDTSVELEFYRKVVYSTNPADRGFAETNAEKLMQFVLLLSQAGYTDEALSVYQHAVPLVNYMDGKQNIPVLLPTPGSVPGQLPYTPRRLQALAHLGIAIKTQDSQNERAHLDEAIRLQPDMAPAYFYKGKALAERPGHARETRDAFHSASLYGDAQTKAEVDKAMKHSSIESEARFEQEKEGIQKNKAARKK